LVVHEEIVMTLNYFGAFRPSRPAGVDTGDHPTAEQLSKARRTFEVSPEVIAARKSVVEGPFEMAAVGYAGHGPRDEAPGIRHLRTIAKTLDDRVDALSEMAEEIEPEAAQDGVNSDVTVEDAQVAEEVEQEVLADVQEVEAPDEELGAPVVPADPGADDDADDEIAEESGATSFSPVRLSLPRRSDVDPFLAACISADSAAIDLLGLNQADPQNEVAPYLDVLHADGLDDGFYHGVSCALLAADAVEVEYQRLVQRIADKSLCALVAPPFAQIDSPLVRAFVPSGYLMMPEGVSYVGDGEKPPVQLTLTPLCVDALVRSATGSMWNARVRALSLDEKMVELLVPLDSLNAGKGAWVGELASLGVPILNEAALRRYALLSLTNMNLPRMLGVAQMGFTQTMRADGSPTLCYVTPGETYFPDGVNVQEEVVMLRQALTQVHRGYFVSGTETEWKEMVGVTRCNHLQTFGLCLAFATPLLPFSKTENGGVHIYCRTSRGKTLVLQLAVTVFGNGSRPDIGGQPTLVQSWHGTTNAIEAQTAAVSGTLAVFDEVGVSRGPVSPYSQTGGQEKGRAKGDGSLQEARSWSTLILSSGEQPIAQQVESKAKRPMMGGEAVRMLDVDVSELLPTDSAREVEALKEKCGQVFGSAGPKFVRWVLNRYDGDAGALQNLLADSVDEMREQLCCEARDAGFVLHTHHVRAMRRLALAAVAGCWAVQADVLPHTEAEIIYAVRAVRDAWLGSQPFVSEEARAVEKVRDYVQRFRGQMVDTRAMRERMALPSNAHGILHQGRVILTDGNFRDACDGLDVRFVASSLDASGILCRNEDQFKSKVSIAELGIHKLRMYVLDMASLLDEGETSEQVVEQPGSDEDDIDMPDTL
jgi:hypothetical protein